MRPFTTIEGLAAPLPLDDVDTDKIIPARFMKTISREGLRAGLFYALAHRSSGEPEPGFVLNKPEFAKAEILLAGRNFGCGSSREHAVWALADFGIRCIVAPSFADIFYQNAIKNGLLPAVVEADAWRDLVAAAGQPGGLMITVDLEASLLGVRGLTPLPFSIAPNQRRVLLEGLDDISQTLALLPAIEAWEARENRRTTAIAHEAGDTTGESDEGQTTLGSG